VSIDLEFVDSIPRTAAGKFRWVISKVPLDSRSRSRTPGSSLIRSEPALSFSDWTSKWLAHHRDRDTRALQNDGLLSGNKRAGPEIPSALSD